MTCVFVTFAVLGSMKNVSNIDVLRSSLMYRTFEIVTVVFLELKSIIIVCTRIL